MTTLTAHTAADYQAAFDAERVKEYPLVDAFEHRMGFAVDRARLEAAARVLACPLKSNPPNWQHGRVLYAAARQYFSKQVGWLAVLDIGTAKGFSALCLHWAMVDASRPGQVISVDVIDPACRERRNTLAEVDGLKTLRETLAPWPESEGIVFTKSTGLIELTKEYQVNVCFVDGKHTGAVVAQEGRLLAARQRAGGLAVFDDVHLEDVGKAVRGLAEFYELETIQILPNRAYAVGIRRG